MTFPTTLVRPVLPALLMFVAAGVGARVLHVDAGSVPACSDATAYVDNSRERPWCTIGRAAWGSTDPNRPVKSQAARAGDTIVIAAGTYSTPAPVQARCDRWGVALNPANSGTSAAPITFRGAGKVDIRLEQGHTGPTIGAARRDYVIWDGVGIDEQAARGTSCPDTGPVVLHATTGSRILNSTIRGAYKAWGDNYNGIRTEYVNQAVIANNTIRDVNCNSGHNCAAIMMYDTANTVVEHNRIQDSMTGIYVKGDHLWDDWPQERNILRFNWFENLSAKAVFLFTARGTRVYQNVVKDSPYAVRVWGDPANADIVIANNTLVSTGVYRDAGGYSLYGAAETLTGLRFFNNIVHGPFGEAVNMGDVDSVGTQSFEHNHYSGYRTFGSVNRAQISWSTWTDVHRQDTKPPAGRTGDPRWADATTYRLSASSPAGSLGIDLLDLNGDGRTDDVIPAGAYVTGRETIGPMPDGGASMSR